jgi:hypothetical protein
MLNLSSKQCKANINNNEISFSLKGFTKIERKITPSVGNSMEDQEFTNTNDGHGNSYFSNG